MSPRFGRQPTRHQPRDASRRRPLSFIAIGVLLAATIALSVWALQPPMVATVGAVRPAAPAADFEPPPEEAPEPASSPTAAPDAQIDATPLRLLSASSDLVAWRATTGQCPGASATPEVSTDGGTTWRLTDATALTDITALTALRALGPAVVELVGLTAANCTPQFVKTFVGGSNFVSYPDRLEQAWFINPANAASVHAPGIDRPTPCAAVEMLAARDAQGAAIVCASGEIFTTGDAGANWAAGGALPGMIAITPTPTGFAATAVGTPNCAGVALFELPGGTKTGCRETTLPASTLAGQVAVSFAGDTFWLWTPDGVFRSTDGGMTWL